MLRTIVITLTLVALMSSCKKEKDDETVDVNEISSLEYFPLNEGNYWVYEHRRIDSNGMDEPFGSELDTVWVSHDTTLNGKEYTILEGRYTPFHNKPHQIIDMLRDSSGYLVTLTGEVLFTVHKFNTILSEDTGFVSNTNWFYVLSKKMKYAENALQLPAGSFNTIYEEGSVVFNPEVTVPFYKRVQEVHYAKGVGKVMQRYFYAASPYTYEKRLVAYYIN